jgi:hypothetical protein
MAASFGRVRVNIRPRPAPPWAVAAGVAGFGWCVRLPSNALAGMPTLAPDWNGRSFALPSGAPADSVRRFRTDRVRPAESYDAQKYHRLGRCRPSRSSNVLSLNGGFRKKTPSLPECKFRWRQICLLRFGGAREGNTRMAPTRIRPTSLRGSGQCRGVIANLSPGWAQAERTIRSPRFAPSRARFAQPYWFRVRSTVPEGSAPHADRCVGGQGMRRSCPWPRGKVCARICTPVARSRTHCPSPDCR